MLLENEATEGEGEGFLSVLCDLAFDVVFLPTLRCCVFSIISGDTLDFQ